LPSGKRAQGKTGFKAPDEAVLRYIEKEGAWFFEERGRHSEKPHIIHEWAEKVSHGPYMELFARSERKGWDCWGHEAPSNGLS
jgi:N6-adenosine-specific RNA methylase IME4